MPSPAWAPCSAGPSSKSWLSSHNCNSRSQAGSGLLFSRPLLFLCLSPTQQHPTFISQLLSDSCHRLGETFWAPSCVASGEPAFHPPALHWSSAAAAAGDFHPLCSLGSSETSVDAGCMHHLSYMPVSSCAGGLGP